MPVVPRYDSPEVRLGGFSSERNNVNAPIEAFGGGQGLDRAANAFSSLASEISKDISNRADQLMVLDADKKASDLETKLLHDPNSGALNKRGKDAFGLPDVVPNDFSKGMDEIRKGLTTDTQKMAFDRMALQRSEGINRQIQIHVSNQIKAFDDETTTASLSGKQNDAITNYDDIGKVSNSINEQHAILTDYAKANGKGQIWLDEKKLEASSKTNIGVVTRMVDNSMTPLAKEFFDQNKKNFTGEDAEKAEKLIKHSSVLGEAQKASDDILAQKLSMTKALEAVRQIKDPDVRKEASSNLEHMFTQAEAARRDATEKQNIQAAGYIDKTGKMPPPSFMFGMTTQQRSAIENYYENKTKGVQPATSWSDWYNLKSMASSPLTRDKFMQIDLFKDYRSKMADAEFKQLADLQTSLRKGDSKTLKALDGYRSDQAIVDNALASIGIPTGNNAKKPDDVAKANAFRKLVEQEQVALQERSGKPASNAEMQNIVDKLAIKTSAPHWWNTDKRVFELTPEDKFDIKIKDVPKIERQSIERALKARRLPITDEAIVDLYTRNIKGSVNGR